MSIRPLARAAAVATLTLPLMIGALPGSAAPADKAPGHGSDKAGAGRPVVEPIVIGHRGASGYRPEHTLASYELAARMGADFIEPDLVMTKDGVLVVRHENNITGTTDVAEHPEFADRRTTKVIDGVEQTGWFTEDFTLAELRTLRAEERLPQLRPGSAAYDGQFQVPTFEEVLQLRERLSAELGREIGVYPETKHPTYFDGLGLSMEEPLVALLEEYGLNTKKAPVFVQSFEFSNLEDLNENLGLRASSVFLMWYDGYPYDRQAAGDLERDYWYYASDAGMKELRQAGIDGVGPEMTMVISWDADGSLGEETGLVDTAHHHRLLVHPYTFRAENYFLPGDYRSGANPAAFGDLQGLIQAYLDAGVDGVFSDHPDIARAAVDAWVAEQKVRPGKGKGPRD